MRLKQKVNTSDPSPELCTAITIDTINKSKTKPDKSTHPLAYSSHLSVSVPSTPSANKHAARPARIITEAGKSQPTMLTAHQSQKANPKLVPESTRPERKISLPGKCQLRLKEPRDPLIDTGARLRRVNLSLIRCLGLGARSGPCTAEPIIDAANRALYRLSHALKHRTEK